jgi:DNA-binding transcriptional MerR regulator
MDRTLPIGDFARATHMSVKTLHYYHRVGLLEPADVDPHTGYRRYTTAQIPTAQIIRRFRDLDMPVDEVAQVLAAPDLDTRNELIATHLTRLEDELSRTQTAVAALQDLLAHTTAPAEVGRRQVPATPAAAIVDTVDIGDALSWYQGALGELYATLDADGVSPAGPAGAIYSTDLFAHERGAATIFVPCAKAIRPMGRVDMLVVPATELATIIHPGEHNGIDLAYGALATYVTDHALAVEGPLREYYLVGRRETPDPDQWRTEIGWPIFHTGPAQTDPATASGTENR